MSARHLRLLSSSMLALGTAIAVACSSGPSSSGTTTKPIGTGGSGAGGGEVTSSSTSSSSGTGGATTSSSSSSTSGSGAGGGGAGGDLGPLPVVDVPDTVCVPRGGVSAELYPGDLGAPVFSQLEKVGARRVAGGLFVEGFVTFDGDGAAPSPAVISIAQGNERVASEGQTIGVGGRIGGDIVYQRFDEDDQPLGSMITLASGQQGSPQIAGGAGEALVVWGAGGVLRARGVDASGGAAGPTFEFGGGSYTNFLRIAAARRPGGFAIAWTGNPTASTYRTSFVLATTTGVVNQVVEVTTSGVRHEVIKLVATPSGYAMLVTGALPDLAPYILLLDAQGTFQSAHRLLGAYFGWDVAVQGSELGVIAARATAEPEFRPFDASMKPLGPWVCLDVPSDINDRGAIDADGTGYAVIYRRPELPAPNGKEIFVRFDHLGTGDPG